MKYSVKVKKIQIGYVEVEADSVCEAEKIALDKDYESEFESVDSCVVREIE